MDAQGLAAILDIFEQKTTGRGPATAEILSILQEVFLRIVEVSKAVVSEWTLVGYVVAVDDRWL